MTDMRGLEDALLEATEAVNDVMVLVWNTSANPGEEWGDLLHYLTKAYGAITDAYCAFLDRLDEE